MPIFDSNEFIEVARSLLSGSDGDKPAFIRTAVGRSYYSQHGYIKLRIESLYPGTFDGRGWHSQVVDVLSASSEKHIRRIGTRFSHLLRLREDADYVPERDIAKADAEGAVDTASESRESIRNLSETDIEAIQKELSTARSRS